MIINKSTIAVLLATYNGEKFIREQLDSLLSQSFTDWTLYIRDDQSTDNTIPIINEYCKKSDKIVLIENDGEKLGAMNNFLRLLSIIDSPYYMFMDEDDVWMCDKIDISYHALKNEECSNKDIPLLVHTNLMVVNKELDVITESFWDSIHFDPHKFHNIHYLSMMGYITGATMLFNKKAKEISFPVNPHAFMHDWWVGISVYRHGGKVISIKKTLMLYRKHGDNVTGDFVASSSGKKISIRLRENITVYRTLRKCNCMNSLFQFLLYKILLFVKKKI